MGNDERVDANRTEFPQTPGFGVQSSGEPFPSRDGQGGEAKTWGPPQDKQLRGMPSKEKNAPRFSDGFYRNGTHGSPLLIPDTLLIPSNDALGLQQCKELTDIGFGIA